MKVKFLRSWSLALLLITCVFFTTNAQLKYDAQFNGTTPGSGSTASPIGLPIGTAIDAAGNVYVADLTNKLIKKFTSSGVLIRTWPGGGRTGIGTAFGSMGNIAVDGSANVYVADFSTRILKYDSTGLLLTYTISGATLNGPRAVVVDASGNVYIAGEGNHRVSVFNSSGVFQRQIGVGTIGTGSNQISGPFGLSIDPTGSFIYVVDKPNNRIMKFPIGATSTTPAVATFGTAQLVDPWSVAVDKAGLVYVTNSANNRVEIYNSSGVVQGNFNAIGSGSNFSYPVGIAIDNYNTGKIYVNDLGNNRMVVFGNCAKGTYSTSTQYSINNRCMATDKNGLFYIAQGTGAGPFSINIFNSAFGAPIQTIGLTFASQPQGIAVDVNLNVYTTVNNLLYKFTAASGYTSYTTYSSLNNPAKVCAGKDGFIYVADFSNNRIVKLNTSLALQGYIGVGASFNGQNFVLPHGIAADFGGFVYATSGNYVWKFSKTGVALSVYDSPNGGSTISRAAAITVDNGGNLLIADEYNYRIAKTDNNGKLYSYLTTALPNNGFSDVVVDNNCNVYGTLGLSFYKFDYVLPANRNGLEEENGAVEVLAAMTVSPNPTISNFNISFAEKGAHEISVYNSNGLEVKRVLINGDNLSINDETLPAGLYVIHDNFNGKVNKAKVLIQKY